MKRMMLVCVVCASLAGCDYTVPLVTAPNAEIDRAVLGLWEKADADDKAERLLVLPLSGTEYLVVFPAGSADAMFARGCLWLHGEMTLLQLDWFGTARGRVPDNNRTFQFASYAVGDDTLKTRLLNAETVARNAASTAGLVEAIDQRSADPRLFRDEMVFRKVKD